MAPKESLFTIVFGWGLCAISWIICAPIMSYFFIKLYEQRNEIMIYKRYPVTTLITYIIAMIDIVLRKPLFILYEIDLIGKDSYIFLFASLSLLPIVYYGFTYGILWKFYLLFYEINYSKESMNDGWKNILNPESGTKSFFLEHHETYGNFYWISKRFIITTIICIIISYILWIIGIINYWYIDIDDGIDYGRNGGYKYMRIATAVDLFLISLPLLFMIYMYFKIPIFYDYFSVRDELKITFIILAIYYIAIVFVQLEKVWLRVFGVDTINAVWFALIYNSITIICQFAVILIQTLWTLQKLEPYLNIKWSRTKSKIEMQDMVLRASQHNDDLQNKETAINTKANSLQNENGEITSGLSFDSIHSNYHQLGIHEVLSKNQSFDAFMLHIVKEFSVEILLCYVEFTQLLQYLFDNYDHMISPEVHDEEVNGTLIDFPSGVPSSYLIATATNGNGMRRGSRKQSKDETGKMDKNEILLLVLFIGSSLYNKYVKKNADLEINISSTLRKKFIAMFTGHNNQDKDVELDVNDVVQLFVDANKSMYKLLGYSFARFKSKKDFERLCESSFSNQTAKSLSNAKQQSHPSNTEDISC